MSFCDYETNESENATEQKVKRFKCVGYVGSFNPREVGRSIHAGTLNNKKIKTTR